MDLVHPFAIEYSIFVVCLTLAGIFNSPEADRFAVQRRWRKVLLIGLYGGAGLLVTWAVFALSWETGVRLFWPIIYIASGLALSSIMFLPSLADPKPTRTTRVTAFLIASVAFLGGLGLVSVYQVLQSHGP
jgi:predicted exporter